MRNYLNVLSNNKNYLDILKKALTAAKKAKHRKIIAWEIERLYILNWSLHPYTKSPFAVWCSENLESIRSLGLDVAIDEDGVSFFGPGCDTWHIHEAGVKINAFNRVLYKHGIYAELWDADMLS